MNDYLSNETQPTWLACPACGAHGPKAAQCLACGYEVSNDYAPGLGLWASYRHFTRPWRDVKPDAARLFPPRNRNTAAQMALALGTYALVPYLGLLFCPMAIACGAWGLWRAWRAPQQGGSGAALGGLLLGFGLGGLHLVLWWLLYQTPRWAAGTP